MYPFYHPNVHYPMNHQYYIQNYRQYPPVDPNLLLQSANASKQLMKDASLVLNKLSMSKAFDAQLMHAAQVANIKEVKRLINSVGVKSKVEVYYSPDGLRLEFSSNVETVDCCKLTIALRWRY